MPMISYVPSPWARQAIRYLDRARGEILDGDDAIVAVSAALAALRIEAGELDEDDAPFFAGGMSHREDRVRDRNE